MRSFKGFAATIGVFFVLAFFSSIADAKQNSCDPDREAYDARVCFEYVQTLEAKNAKVKSDLAAARRETAIAKSQLVVAQVQHSRTAMSLGFDIELQKRLLSGGKRTIELLSEEKEVAWRYVDMVLKVSAAVIGLAFLAGIVGLYFLRRTSPDRRYAVEMRDERIRELENKLHVETDAKLIAMSDVTALRFELFHKGGAALRLELSRKNSDLERVRKQYNNLREYVRREMARFETLRVSLLRSHAAV